MHTELTVGALRMPLRDVFVILAQRRRDIPVSCDMQVCEV
jgi:hypothetical protein